MGNLVVSFAAYKGWLHTQSVSPPDKKTMASTKGQACHSFGLKTSYTWRLVEENTVTSLGRNSLLPTYTPIKKAERWRINVFELWYWRRFLSSLDYKEIQIVHPKGDMSWVFIGRTDVEAETPILWPSDVKSWLIWKGPDAGKYWGKEEEGATEDEKFGWHHRLKGHEFG